MNSRSLIRLAEIETSYKRLVGGKAAVLADLMKQGWRVPDGLVVPADVYTQYIKQTALDTKILFEIGRKAFKDMRWEEIWDAGLRIRNLFLRTPLPDSLTSSMTPLLEEVVGEEPVVVRSSAPEEDAAATSFAGLHESYVNVRGAAEILRHIRLVWASLWSDRALLYRQELGLDVKSSSMAVLIQRMVSGQASGILFTRDPNNADQMLVESVYGLNQALVDGSLEPDRWVLLRSGEDAVVSHTPGERDRILVATKSGTEMVPLEAANASTPPLNADQLQELRNLGAATEAVYGGPQDIEWTFSEGLLHVLQARPISTASTDSQTDRRAWYLSLHRSYENLTALWSRIENECIPGMDEDAKRMNAAKLSILSDAELADVLEERQSILDNWTSVYWEEFIPFAHGMRLFGEVYNDVMSPDDPYAFMDLLVGTELQSTRRNEALIELAEILRNDQDLQSDLRNGEAPGEDTEFARSLDAFMETFDTLPSTEGNVASPRKGILQLVLKLSADGSATEKKHAHHKDPAAQEEAFFHCFSEERRDLARNLLDLGRASYRLRDDDNIFLGRLEAQVTNAQKEAVKRISDRIPDTSLIFPTAELAHALSDPTYVPVSNQNTNQTDASDSSSSGAVRSRQLTGQPASRGIATGAARVVHTDADLYDVQVGDVLVCDVIDPNMTFVIPLTSAIVERRGGMLIHGAIIAREYGIPCVTGVPEAVNKIPEGVTVTVDGYLGVVTES